MKSSKTLFCSLKFARAGGNIYLKFIDNLSTRQHKFSPALASIPRFTYTLPPSACSLQDSAARCSLQ